jgi:flagellar motor protein MotB
VSDTQAWSAAKLNEKLENSSAKDLKTLKESGMLPSDVVRYLSVIERHYDPDYGDNDDPYYAWETETYQDIVKLHASQRLSTAIQNGNKSIINHFLGVVDTNTSLAHIQVYERFRRWVTREASVTYLAANMGYGKTDFALLMAEIWESSLEGSTKNGNPVRLEVASNVKSCTQAKTITSQPDLAEWMQDGGDDDEEVYKLFIFDEASSHASGYSKDASKVQQQLSSMIKLMRKNGGNIIIIGHTGKDVHPDVRRLSDFVQKESKKEAVIFEDVREGKGSDKKFELSEIPPTSWKFDTNEESTWEWASGAAGGKDMTQIACEVYLALKDGKRKTQKEVAEMFDISQSKISQNYKEYA